RQRFKQPAAIKTDALQHLIDEIAASRRLRARLKPRRHLLAHCPPRSDDGLLAEIADAHARLQEALAAIEINLARERLQKRRFAGPVAPDERDAHPRLDTERDVAEEIAAAKGDARVLQGQKGCRHKSLP